MTTEQKNRMIAKFMGARLYQAPNYHKEVIWWAEYPDRINPLGHDNIRNISSLEYHTSWDWLMPVAIEIKSRTYENFWIESTKSWPLMMASTGDINQVYEAVSKFINHLNQQP